MASPSPFFTQQAISPEQIGDDVLGVEEDVIQLREDSVEVLEGRIDIYSFDEDYQQKIRNYYRFSCTRYGSKYGLVAKRTKNTLDII
jgi:hypothetical protein